MRGNQGTPYKGAQVLFFSVMNTHNNTHIKKGTNAFLNLQPPLCGKLLTPKKLSINWLKC